MPKITSGTRLTKDCEQVDNCPLVLPYWEYGKEDVLQYLGDTMFFDYTHPKQYPFDNKDFRNCLPIGSVENKEDIRQFVERFAPDEVETFLRDRIICNRKEGFAEKGRLLKLKLRKGLALGRVGFAVSVIGARFCVDIECIHTYGTTLTIGPMYFHPNGEDYTPVNISFEGVGIPILGETGAGMLSVSKTAWSLSSDVGSLGGTMIDENGEFSPSFVFGAVDKISDAILGEQPDGMFCTGCGYYISVQVGHILDFDTEIYPPPPGWEGDLAPL